MGGRTIRRLEEESGAQISFQAQGEALMVLRGSAQQRARAKELAEQVLASERVRAQRLMFLDPR